MGSPSAMGELLPFRQDGDNGGAPKRQTELAARSVISRPTNTTPPNQDTWLQVLLGQSGVGLTPRWPLALVFTRPSRWSPCDGPPKICAFQPAARSA